MSRDALHVVDDLALDRGTGRTDGVRIVGHVVAEMFGPDGVLKARVESHNLITAVGDQPDRHETRYWLHRSGQDRRGRGARHLPVGQQQDLRRDLPQRDGRRGHLQAHVRRR